MIGLVGIELPTWLGVVLLIGMPGLAYLGYLEMQTYKGKR